MKFIISIVCCFLLVTTNGQVAVSGKITDKETGKALAGVSVYINNTSIGTISDANGDFVIKNISLQKYDLIASYIGYETYNNTITADKNISLSISLNPKAKELDEIVVGPYEKNGWEKWGRLFTEYFIGTSINAKDCSIKNTKALRFRMSKKDNTLYADAVEPLQIENDALGYQLTYDMQAFSYNFSTHMLYYAGYPFFTEMKGGNKKTSRWQQRRKESYKGSMLHFMRCIYRNNLKEEGFTMYRVTRVFNKEKERVQYKYRSLLKLFGSEQIDSSEYYQSVLRQPDFSDFLDKNPIIADSVAFAFDSTTAGLSFKNYLQVVYANKLEPLEFANAQGRHYPEGNIASLITLLHHNAVAVYENGMYYDSKDVLSEGFWGWSEKIGEMLPFDYVYKPH